MSLGAGGGAMKHKHTSSWLAIFASCLACRTGGQGGALNLVYPDLLRQAGVSGFYQFRVGLDSTGAPNLKEFRTLVSPNPGFDYAVKRAVASWRPHAPPGTQSIEHAILFVVLPYGVDSARACPPERGYSVVCAIRSPIHAETVH